jgi:hypothetical protein
MLSLNRHMWSTLAVFVILSPSPAPAQTIANSFEELQTVLKKGQTVIVTDASGQRVKGKVADVSPSSLVVLIPEARTFAEGTVTEIRAAADSLRNGALIGVGVGVGAGVAVILAKCDNGPDCSYALKVGAGYAGIGAAIGAGIDALVNKAGRVLYRSRQQTRSLTLSPLLGKDRQGALVSVRF